LAEGVYKRTLGSFGGLIVGNRARGTERAFDMIVDTAGVDGFGDGFFAPEGAGWRDGGGGEK
jgi:hypothetical protein